MRKQQLCERIRTTANASYVYSSRIKTPAARWLHRLEAYNEFAKVFNCQIYPPEHLYWKQDLLLEGGVRLRVHGLTSTLLCGANGSDDRRDDLYLSPLQTVLDPVDDIVNLVLCHHPPDWFCDQNDVNVAMCGRAAIHLFGHEHNASVTMDDGYIRLATGAVNPDRYAVDWQTQLQPARRQRPRRGP